MKKLKDETKNIFEESIFGALFALWTAPCDERKLDLYLTGKSSKIINIPFFNNLIIGQKS